MKKLRHKYYILDKQGYIRGSGFSRGLMLMRIEHAFKNIYEITYTALEDRQDNYWYSAKHNSQEFMTKGQISEMIRKNEIRPMNETEIAKRLLLNDFRILEK